MTQEEKAKAYDDSLKRAKKLQETCDSTAVVGWCEYIFPELKESEDELTWLTKYVEEEAYSLSMDIRDSEDRIKLKKLRKSLAWLEKQGKKDNQVKLPPFTFDDILALQCCMETVKKVQEDKELYEQLQSLHNRLYDAYLVEKQGEQKSFDYENANIQQKDFAPKADMPRYSIGDVLCDKSCTMLNKESQSNFEITDIRNGMYICDKCSFPISQQDEYELVAKRIEQKPADKVETKFKVGDWIIYDGHISKVKDMDSEGYLVEDNYGDEGVPPKEFAEKHYHLWTIVDAKDGDVLTFKNDICGIIICKSPTDYDTGSYCRLASDNFINKEESGWDSTLLVPATKEQRDTLFKAMHEAGYMWDSESKQLLSLKAEPSGEQKPAWSEEDDAYKLFIISAVEDYYDDKNPLQKELVNWIKSIKGRIGVVKANEL